MAKTNVVTKDELETAISEIWQVAQDSDGSRPGMLDALDEIQNLCVGVIPDLDETSDDSDDEGE